MSPREKEYWHKAAALEQKLFDGRISYPDFRNAKQDLKNHCPGGMK